MATHPAFNRSESMNRAFAAIVPSLQMCCCCLQSMLPQTGRNRKGVLRHVKRRVVCGRTDEIAPTEPIHPATRASSLGILGRSDSDNDRSA